MRLITQVVCMAVLLLLTLATQASSTEGTASSTEGTKHVDYETAHCDLDHGSSKAYAGYVFHTATGTIVHSWWNRRELGEGQKATKSVSGDLITVKIRQLTPYNNYVTVASKSCSGGH